MDYEIEKKHHGVAEKPIIWTPDLPIVTSINPALAKEIGLNESIVLRQIAFWISNTNNFRDGDWWTYQSLEDMHEKAFPYWHTATISRIVNDLVKLGLIKKTSKYNVRGGDRTQWFALNVENVSKLTSVKVILQNAKWELNDAILQDAKSENFEVILQDAKSILQNATTLPEYKQQNTKTNLVLDAQAHAPTLESDTAEKEQEIFSPLGESLPERKSIGVLGRVNRSDEENPLSPKSPSPRKSSLSRGGGLGKKGKSKFRTWEEDEAEREADFDPKPRYEKKSKPAPQPIVLSGLHLELITILHQHGNNTMISSLDSNCLNLLNLAAGDTGTTVQRTYEAYPEQFLEWVSNYASNFTKGGARLSGPRLVEWIVSTLPVFLASNRPEKKAEKKAEPKRLESTFIMPGKHK